jgi:nitrite reductase/ring-hydroxylating ferredoxin subunit
MKKSALLFWVLCFAFSSCKKEKNNGYINIPDFPFDIYIFTNDPQYFNLSVVGGWGYIDGGSRGILVYHASTNEFTALERHCPHDATESNGRVVIDSSNFVMARCLGCNSRYVLFDGSVSSGPATIALKRYRTQVSGNQLRIYN